MNLLKDEDISNTTNNGISFTKTNDSIKISGTLTQSSAILQLPNIVDRLTIGKTYTALIVPVTTAPFQFIIIENGTRKYVKEFTHNSNITSVVPYIQPMGSVGSVYDKIAKIKVFEKRDNTAWSPYGCGTVEVMSKNDTNTSSNIVATKPLCGIEDIRDEIDYTKRKVIRRLDKIVLKGTENIIAMRNS